MKGRSGAIFALSVGVLLCCALAAGHEAGPTLAGDAVVLENGVCRYEIGLDGKNRAFADAGRRKDYCAPGQPFMMAAQGEKTWPS